MTGKIFIAKTSDAFCIKILTELLSNNLKTGSFNISEQGIKLREWNKNRISLFDVELDSDNFPIYKFKEAEPIHAGLTLNHLLRVIKPVKKKDSIRLFIKSSLPGKLSIQKIPKENNSITTSTIKIQNIQNIEAEIPMGYDKPIIIPSAQFQKMFKDLSVVDSPLIKVMVKESSINFSVDTEGILDTNVTLGETHDDDSEDDVSETDQEVKYATFANEHLSKISKIAGLGPAIKIFPGSDKLPYLFRTDIVGDLTILGKISIYIKSQELVKREKEENSDSEDSDNSDSDNSDNSDNDDDSDTNTKVPVKPSQPKAARGKGAAKKASATTTTKTTSTTVKSSAKKASAVSATKAAVPKASKKPVGRPRLS